MRSVVDVILLCGGAGLRLRSVIGNAPKGMAEVGGRPFLELLLRQIKRHGFERVILAVGYQCDVIRKHFGERAFGLDVAYSVEASALGTGGALRNAARLATSKDALIMNGDSYTDADLHRFVTDHLASGAEVSVVVVPADGRGDCGTVNVHPNGRLAGFVEKESAANGRYANAGIYMASLQILNDIPDGQVSLERELFPRWLEEGREIRAFVSPGTCVDIGTPERYGAAQDILATAEVATGGMQHGGSL
jgi:NDP-sugar pyrophosphorylase family protein